MKHIYKFAFLMALCVSFIACNDDDELDTVTSGPTQLIEAALLNTGVDENVKAVGVVDETAKTLTFKVPFETILKALKIEAKVSDGAHLTPQNGSFVDFSIADKKIAVVSGLNNTIYKVIIDRELPTAPTVTEIYFSGKEGAKHISKIDYKKKEIIVNVLSIYQNVAKIDSIKTGPVGTTYTLNPATTGFIDLEKGASLTFTNGDKTATFNLKSVIVPVGFDPLLKRGDFSAFASAVPSQIEDNLSRDAHMSNGFVYAPSRKVGNHVYFWDVNQVFLGKNDPQELNLDGITFEPAAWPVSAVYTVGDKIYVCNMVNAATQKLQVWYWANNKAKAVEVLNYTLTDPIAPAASLRLGDCFSVVVDKTGKGKIFFSNFPWPSKQNQFYSFDITDYKTVSASPTIFNVDLGGGNVGQYGRINAVPDNASQYILTGADMGIALIDAKGKVELLVDTDVVQGRAQDMNIFTYNSARYLGYTVNREWGKGEAFGEVINITDGATTFDALKKLTAANVESKKVYKEPIGNPSFADGWVSATSSFEVLNGEIRAMHFSTLNGFVILKGTPAK